ncbi:uncharacterized protein LOC107761733 isoform X5 [Nicotiana tabacum]|uniref:Uncharacterized protein LOC107761733 isoform X5 n=2 Tax=Nicotiana TaxID=4085 RepID=A0AC58RL77_TOBAC|nr:PREDICTED: uncharacterized protein LOC104224767 isoform X3 [Nicotiana sylvestris]
MATAKMSRGLVMLTFTVVAIVLCSHRLATAEEEMKQLEEVVETSKAMDNKSSCNQQLQEQPTCCAKDKEKIKNCMLNTASIDQCCPTFSIMLGRNCDCYNYAKDLDNQALITLESYCDVTNPCRSAQVM